MGYDATDTARAAEKLGRDMDTLEANELAAWDHFAIAAFPTIALMLQEDESDDLFGHAAQDCGHYADHMIRERRKRLVAARVGQEATEIVAEAAVDAELRSAAIAFVTAHIAPFEDAGKTPEALRLQTAAVRYGKSVRDRTPPPSALTAEQRAVIDEAREFAEGTHDCTDALVEAVCAMNAAETRAAEGRPQ